MEENKTNPSEEKKSGMNRRDLIKGLATIPVLGALGFGLLRKNEYDSKKQQNLRQLVDLNSGDPKTYSYQGSQKIRLGVIGYGIRGRQLMKATGYAHPDMIQEWIDSYTQNANDHRYNDFREQDDLNIEITAVSDLFTVYAEQASMAASNVYSEGKDSK